MLFQFVAKTPKDMEEWVKKICKLGGDERNEHKDVAKVMVNVTVTGGSENTKPNDPDESERKEERYQDVGSLLNTDKHSEEQPNVSIETNVEADNSLPNDDFLDNSSPFPSSTDALTVAPSHTPPPPAQLCPSSLSTRIPRKLPSLPACTVPRSSFEFPEEEEDDIYHKIDDFRDSMRYGNVGETFQAHQSNNDSPIQQLITYDDVRVGVKTETKIEEKRNEGDVEAAGMKSGSTRGEDTYDDATAATVGQDNKITEHPDKFVSYDDVEVTAYHFSASSIPIILPPCFFRPPLFIYLFDIHIVHIRCFSTVFFIERGFKREIVERPWTGQGGRIGKVAAKEIISLQSKEQKGVPESQKSGEKSEV